MTATLEQNGTGTELAVQQVAVSRAVVTDDSQFANLLDSGKFAHLQRLARLFAASKMVPLHFQGVDREPDCFIAIQMALRLGVDPFMFLQHTYVISGKPGMESKLAIALINSSGLFSGPLRFELSGDGDSRGCEAYAAMKSTGEEVRGPRVTIATAKADGWYGRNGSKWKTIPDLMLQYRAGAWFGRLYCPERLMGMQTVDELRDTHAQVAEPAMSKTTRLNAALKVTGRPVSEGQTFEADPEAVAAAAQHADTAGASGPAGDSPAPPESAGGDTSIDTTAAEAEKRAADGGDDLAREAAERELLEQLADPSAAEWAYTQAMEAGGMSRADAMKALSAYAVKNRVKGKMHTLPREAAMLLHQACSAGRVAIDGTIRA